MAVARAHGVRVDEPVVVRQAWHVLVHLRPAPIVARVTSGAAGVDPNDVVRELAVAGHAARAGAPVVPPSDLIDPGPHEHAGHTLAFWRYVEKCGEPDAATAGAGLFAIHEALATFDGPLPALHDVGLLLAELPPSDDRELLCELAARPLPAGQALHGDAHLFNCMSTTSGQLWHDFETACRGPREYDLAALVQRQRIHGDDARSAAALAAYGEYDADLLEAALPVYAAWITAAWLVALPRRPELAVPADRQLAFLRRYRDN
ncbi:MAG TPA: phosphotransferase [Gaiellaceae bacterium]|nr:phosphotransferase [Gaiellaceae bacterium]